MNLDKEKSYLIETKDSKYLKAADMPENFNARLKIKAVDEEEFESDDGKVTNKLVLFFADKDKGITLSPTNSLTLRGAFGPETDKWHGQEILLTTKYYPKFSTSGFIVNAIPQAADDGLSESDIPW